MVFDNKTGANLLQWPVEEIGSLRLSSKEFNNVEMKPGSVVPLDVGPATQLDITAEFELDQVAVERMSILDVNEDFTCSTSGGAAHRGALGPFGLLVLANEKRSEQTPVFFYIAKRLDGKLATFFCTDQSRYDMIFLLLFLL